MPIKLSLRAWINLIMVALICLVLILARHDLIKAWHLLGKTDIGIFLLIIPVQFISYYASGETIFSYLRQLGELRHVSKTEPAQMALELNFMNHIAPSAGVSGAAYMNWRLGKLGVSQSRATLAQIIKHLMTYVAFVLLIIVAVFAITLDGSLNRMTILASSALATMTVVGTGLVMYIVQSRSRMQKFAHWLDRLLNQRLARLLKRREPIWQYERIYQFFDDLHADYLSVRTDPRLLKQPFIWSVVFNMAEATMYVIAFASFGAVVNPAPILVAIGLAGFAGAFLATPGGAGGYELIMITFLVSAGIPAGVATAGVILARAVLIIITIISGAIALYLAQKKYGKAPD